MRKAVLCAGARTHSSMYIFTSSRTFTHFPRYAHLFNHEAFYLLYPLVAHLQHICAYRYDTLFRFFDVCQKKYCILFRTEEPIVKLDPSMRDHEHQRPFPCSQYSRLYYGKLEGPLFKFIGLVMPLENAYCVWVGPDCTFDGMLDFMGNSSAAGLDHLWIVGSLLYIIPRRISRHSIPSTPIYEDEIRIVGPPIEGYYKLREAWKNLNTPFTWKGWVYIFVCIIGHFLLRVFMVFMFSMLHEIEKYFDWGRFLNFDNSYTKTSEAQEKWWRRIKRFWLLVASIFIVTSLLFWEVAMAMIVYGARLDAHLENIDPTRVAMIQNTSQEEVFKALVKSSAVVWNQFKSGEEVQKALLDKSNNIDYTISYKYWHKYKMNTNPEICENLRLYDDVPSQLVANRKPPILSGSWWYSSAIPEQSRIKIDKAIARNKQRGRFQKVMDDVAGENLSDACKLKNNRIDWVLLLLLHVATIGPLLVLAFLSICIFLIRDCIQGKRSTTGSDAGGNFSSEANDKSGSGLDDEDSGVDLSDLLRKHYSICDAA